MTAHRKPGATAVAELIERLRAARVRLWADGDRLRYEAPPHALSPALLAELRSRKVELLAFLRAAAAGGEAAPGPIPRVPRDRPLPLSTAQQRLWLLYHLDGRGPAYNVPKAVRLQGPLEAGALARAFGELVARHEALRTVIAVRQGEPVQVVHEPAPFALAEDYLAALPEAERLPMARVRVAEEARRPFDLEQAPLMRARLCRLGPDDHVLVTVLHHVAADGRSLEILFEELALLYGAIRDGQPGALPPLPIQYADYAAFERTWLRGESMERKAAWWREYLADAPRQLRLPVDRPRPPGPDFAGDLEHVVIPSDLVNGLRRLARDAGASLYMATLAVLGALLARYGGQEEVCIGSPVENRPFPETAGLVGAFINTIVLRVSLAGDPSFVDLLGRVRDAALEAFERQDVPFERLAEALQPDRSPRAAPVVQVAVSWLDGRRGFLALPGLRATPVDFEFHSVKFDLNLEVYETDDDLHVAWFYSSALFDRETVRRLARHFRGLLESALAEPARPVARLAMLSAAEGRRLIAAWNATDMAHPTDATVVGLFEAQARATPAAIAVTCGEQSVGYAELDHAASRIARRLAAGGAGPGRIVGVLLEHSIELVAALLGVLKSGAAYLPLDPSWPDERLAFAMTDAGAVLLVAGARTLEGRALPPAVAVLPVDSALGAAGPPDGAGGAPAGPADAAYVMYTSGSTGTPKGVVVEHGALLNYVWWARSVYGQGEPLDWPLFTSVAFDLTVTSLYVPLLSGGRVVVYRDDPRAPAIFQVLRDQAVDVVKLTPAHLALIAGLDLRGARIRRLVVGGEDLKADVCRRIHDAFGGAVEICNEYGPTEATVGCTLHRFDPTRDRAISIPIGVPAGNARVYVLDGHRAPVPPGVIGELYIGGDGVARGYLGRPDLTAERFLPDPFRPPGRMYRSGDLARWRPDGVLEYLGRADHQVKIRGYRVELDEVASLLASHEAVTDCVVVAVDREAIESPPADAVRHCARCGLATSYPGTVLDDEAVCDTCHAFDKHRHRVEGYFRKPADLQALLEATRVRRRGPYDCLALLSGGKDSTYMVARLAEMGLRILAYTFDPGYLSEEAKANIRRVTGRLRIDHVFGETPHMREIFADSLRRHANVCNGCFKTLYTLSMRLAEERGIPVIVTGLSRGQLFETRLSRYYHCAEFDPETLDRAVVEARKVYHRLDDVVARRLDVSAFRDDRIFESVQIVDFYRYVDVRLDDVLAFLEERLGWRRPADTGRSTNCLINEVGIYTHKRARGYHNYALPYSWDVRMGHKTRAQALEELDDPIDVTRVRRILADLGVDERSPPAGEGEKVLVAYCVLRGPVSAAALRAHLARRLPDAMLPALYVGVERLPLTRHGKVDRAALPAPRWADAAGERPAATPRTPLERDLAGVFASVLGLEQVGIHDSFFALGGHSLMATRLVARVAEAVGVELPLATVFERPTVAELSEVVGRLRAAGRSVEEILAEVEALSDDEARDRLRS
jgi:amino acid adenylation domain-containing protein